MSEKEASQVEVLNSIYPFLKKFRREGEEIYLGILHEDKTIKNKLAPGMTYMPFKIEDLDRKVNSWTHFMSNGHPLYIRAQNNSHGKAIFFCPSLGGKNNASITDIRAYFIDKDDAKVTKHFESLEEAQKASERLVEIGDYQKALEDHKGVVVRKGKEKNASPYYVEFLRNKKDIERDKKIWLKKYKSSLKDTVIVETYSGFHVYWILDEGADKETFSNIQKQLAEKFEADTSVSNPARFMRLVGFKHLKYDDHPTVTIIQDTDKKWSKEKVLKKYKITEEIPQTKGFVKTEFRTTTESDEMGVFSRDIMVEKNLGDSGIEFNEKVVTEISGTQMSFDAFVEWIKKQNFNDFVENVDFSSRMNCLFHDDKRPSAGVHLNEDGDETLYTCNSCSVNTMNIITMYQRVLGHKPYREAVKDLAEKCGVKIIKSDFEVRMNEKLIDNGDFLEKDLSSRRAKDMKYPNLYHWTKNPKKFSLLYRLNTSSRSNYISDDYQYKGHNIFFISTRHAMSEMDASNRTMANRTLNLFSVLGLIERVPTEVVKEVAPSLYKRGLKEKINLYRSIEKYVSISNVNRKNMGAEEKVMTIKPEDIKDVSFFILHNWKDKAHEIEKTARLMREKRFTIMNDLNFKGIKAMFGEGFARAIFPQNSTNEYEEYILRKLKEKLEKDTRKNSYGDLDALLSHTIRSTKEEEKYVSKEDKEKVINSYEREFVPDGYELIKTSSAAKLCKYNLKPRARKKRRIIVPKDE